MKIKPLLVGLWLFAVNSQGYATECVGNQLPPPGKPNDFNVNEELAEMEKLAAGHGDDFLGEILKRAEMADLFWPEGGKYDLKDTMGASQEFGNWFYGTVASVMGIPESEALHAGAIIQQYQNRESNEIPDLAVAVGDMLETAVTGCCDNPDDPPQISGGHSYGEDIYKPDENRTSKSNSCSNVFDNLENETSGMGIGTSGGGMFISGGLAGTCIGSCTIITVEEIEDLPEEDEEEEEENANFSFK